VCWRGKRREKNNNKGKKEKGNLRLLPSTRKKPQKEQKKEGGENSKKRKTLPQNVAAKRRPAEKGREGRKRLACTRDETPLCLKRVQGLGLGGSRGGGRSIGEVEGSWKSRYKGKKFNDTNYI